MEKTVVNKKAFIIGGSAGSLEVLLYVLPKLRIDLSFPIIIVLHRKATNDTLLGQLLASKTAIPVTEIEEKELIQDNHIYVAPADYHLLIENDFTFSLDYSEKINFSRPSIDVSFQSAAEVYGSSLIALLLSGANSDGTEGLKEVKERGGTALIQHPDSAEVDFMPKAAIMANVSGIILRTEEIPEYINSLMDLH